MLSLGCDWPFMRSHDARADGPGFGRDARGCLELKTPVDEEEKSGEVDRSMGHDGPPRSISLYIRVCYEPFENSSCPLPPLVLVRVLMTS